MRKYLKNTGPSTRPENKLMIACARRHLNAAFQAQITSLLKGALDWSYIEQTAQRHGLLPLLYSHLNIHFSAYIDAAQLKRFECFFITNAKKNLLCAGELIRLLKELNADGILAMPYKGLILAEAVYGDIALRHCYDIDILVRKADVQRVKEILLKRG